jgi:hypothetical protein
MVKYDLSLHEQDVGASSAYRVVHKGACDQATEPETTKSGWMELDVFLARTMLNAVPQEDAADEESAMTYVERAVGSAFRLRDLDL